MSDRKKQELLHTPEGVWDHYGADCLEYEKVTARIRTTMHRYGYEDIRTPTFEFFDVFSKEIGTTPSRELYKFFDKEGNTLVLRPDFTPPIARCAAKYFMDETRPLKFCYEGSAFINTSNLQGKLKETIQLGAECINDGSAVADAEMLSMLIRCLQNVGLKKFQITVGNVEYFKGICDAAGLDQDTELELREYVSGKNYFAADNLLRRENVGREFADQILQIASFAGNDSDLEEMRKSAPNERAEKAITRLIEVYKMLKVFGKEQYISFDLSLLSKYRYYTGVIFKAYTYGVGDCIATGGRYDTLLSQFGKDAPAIGFMIPADTLIEAMRAQNIAVEDAAQSEKPVVVAYTEQNLEQKMIEVQAMRRSGRNVSLVPENCR